MDRFGMEDKSDGYKVDLTNRKVARRFFAGLAMQAYLQADESAYVQGHPDNPRRNMVEIVTDSVDFADALTKRLEETE